LGLMHSTSTLGLLCSTNKNTNKPLPDFTGALIQLEISWRVGKFILSSVLVHSLETLSTSESRLP